MCTSVNFQSYISIYPNNLIVFPPNANFIILDVDCGAPLSMSTGADLQGGRGGLQPPLQLLQPWISEVGDEEEEVEERRKWREGEEEEEISPPLIHFLDPPLTAC